MGDKVTKDAVKRMIVSAVATALDYKKRNPKTSDGDAMEHVMKKLDEIIDSVK
jgi:hypothetical protein